MPEDVDDYWPEHFTAAWTDPPPAALLRRQADLLAGRTNNVVKGVVTEGAREGTAYYSLYLTAPALGEEQFKILSIAFPWVRGPAHAFPLIAYDSSASKETKLANMDEFRAWLKGVLSSELVATIVGELIRRSDDREFEHAIFSHSP